MSATMEQYQLPRALNATKEKISSFAEKVAEQCDYDPTSKDIQKVIESLNGKIDHKSWDDNFEKTDASLIVRGHRDFTVVLSDLCGSERNRFSAAHELGHYLLHYEIPKLSGMLKARRSGENVRVEWEANWFAAAFLMPAEKFRQAYRRYNKDMRLVARHFQVSEVAADVRKKSLGSV